MTTKIKPEQYARLYLKSTPKKDNKRGRKIMLIEGNRESIAFAECSNNNDYFEIPGEDIKEIRKYMREINPLIIQKGAKESELVGTIIKEARKIGTCDISFELTESIKRLLNYTKRR